MLRIFHVGDRTEYQLISALLSQVHHTDYQLTSCLDTADAIAEMLSPAHDIVLLDYHWRLRHHGSTSETTRDLLRRARTLGCDKPIIVMTDDMEAEVDREAIRVGASDYLIKGRIDSQLIERTLRYAIERKHAERELARLAHFDQLTGLPNRVLFRDRLEHALQLADRGGPAFALMYLDLNGFKAINDNLGHDIGDKLLQSCGRRLSDCVRKSDSVARIGGDEFTVLLEQTDSVTDIARIAEKIIETLSQAHAIDGREIQVGCSIGIAVFPDAGRGSEALQRNADTAMYQAKAEAQSSYRFFSERMNIEARRQLLLANDLRRAVERKQFSLRFDVRRDLISGGVAAIVSRVRWYHPARGWMEPNEFFSLAEHTGLIRQLGYWQLRQIGDDCRALPHAIDALPPIVIKVTARQLDDAQMLQAIREELDLCKRVALRLHCEFLARDLSEHSQAIENFCHALHQPGISFGVSGLALDQLTPRMLQRLPLTSLGIAMPAAPIDSDTESLLRALAEFGRLLGKRLVAESIDEPGQEELACRLGIRQGQGDRMGSGDRLLDVLQTPARNGVCLA